MENTTDSLLNIVQFEFDAESLGSLLCNAYAMGYFDKENDREPEINQSFLLMAPIMDYDIAQEYIETCLDRDEGGEGGEENFT